MNAYEKAQSLGLSGTDSEIVVALRAMGLTARPINRAELIHLLNMRGMLRKIVGNNSDEKWIGTVLNMQDAILAMGTDEQKNGIRLWFSHVTNQSNQIWDTTQFAFAGAFWQLYLIFRDQPNMPSGADFEAIASLGGGWLFADLTEEQFTAQRITAEVAIARQSIIDGCIDPIRTTHSAAVAKLNNAQASLGHEHVDGLTLEELQARCDVITASETGEV